MENKTQLVALVGGSGAGKTWLARRLQRALGPLVTRLGMDEFYVDHLLGASPVRLRTNSEHPRTVDWPALRSALRRARSASTSGRIVLVDGIWLLTRRDIRELFDFCVYLECPAQLRLERRLARDLDIPIPARNAEAARRHFWHTVEPMHARHVVPQAAWADIVMQQPPTEQEVENLAETLRALAEPDSVFAGADCEFPQPDYVHHH